MKFFETQLSGAYVIEFNALEDERGWFLRTYCKEEFDVIGHKDEWVQQNYSFTKKKGTVRGLHYQRYPRSELKLIRCVSGKVFDVMVDLRKESPTFLKWFGIELSAKNKKMVYIPHNFAHGFQTLEENSQMTYLHSEYYSPQHEGGLRFDDPQIGIKWPQEVTQLSEKDRLRPYLETDYKGVKL